LDLSSVTARLRGSSYVVLSGLDTGLGHVEEVLVAEELWNDHKKPFFFPFSSAVTCTNHSLEVDQRFYVERFV
ncbi:hypothetical protein Taro_055062, partial [Colocasia esculenta]|nr:hypothetical protein [Colocasia esculenta]